MFLTTRIGTWQPIAKVTGDAQSILYCLCIYGYIQQCTKSLQIRSRGCWLERVSVVSQFTGGLLRYAR